MLRWSLPLLLALASCSKGPDADLEYIGQARSAAAEWAMVNEQAAGGKVTDVYVRSMHQWIRQQIQTSATSLTEPDSPYGDKIAALLQQPDDAAPQELRQRAAALKQIEDKLESA
jgi:Tfp pilus assembly protein PilP